MSSFCNEIIEQDQTMYESCPNTRLSTCLDRLINSASNEPTLALPDILVADWLLILLSPDVAVHPDDLPDARLWVQAKAPGTAYEALYGDSSQSIDISTSLHDYDVWYQTTIHAEKGEKLRFDGLAGLAEIWLDDKSVTFSESMYTFLSLDINTTGQLMISIRFRSLNKALQHVVDRPRWRTKLVTSNSIRVYRQTLLGHMPGWCPNIHAIGPYRPIYHIKGLNVIERCLLDTKMLTKRHAIFSIRLAFLRPYCSNNKLTVRLQDYAIPLDQVDERSFEAKVTLTDIEPWWPHTHGEPKLYEVFVDDGSTKVSVGKIGFRSLAVIQDVKASSFQFEINGLPIFCRGACWTNADLAGLGSDRATYANWLKLARDAGMNMIRISGIMMYESKNLHDLCDELGILVWQDLMFASLDYPTEDPSFRQNVLVEVKQLVERLAASPSLALLCGGSEVAQQAVMLGLPKDRWSMPFFEIFLRDFISGLKPDLIYIPNSPWEGSLPINANSGVSHYYGVGAYERPLEDARRANVRFAAECLAFANLPSTKIVTYRALLDSPRDPGTAWTFCDTRDYYLKQLYEVEPARLRFENPGRYLALSQAVTADVMEAVFSEWRRPGSTCTGGLIWQLQDLSPGSGWGIIDSSGCPKPAWYGLQRVFAPVQILISNEGINGIDLYVLNETPKAMACSIRLTCLSHSSKPAINVKAEVTVQSHSSISTSIYSLYDGFLDVNSSYRFGPTAYSVVVASIICSNSGILLSQAFYFPAGRTLPAEELGIRTNLVSENNTWMLKVLVERFAQAVELNIPGYRPVNNWFHLLPHEERTIELILMDESVHRPSGYVSALNSRVTHYF